VLLAGIASMAARTFSTARRLRVFLLQLWRRVTSFAISRVAL